MNLSGVLRALRDDPANRERIVHVHEQSPRAALYEDLASPLPTALNIALVGRGITRLYVHQARAVEAARQESNVGVVTATASGKTLCYHLPTLEALLAEPRDRALYLFPTKALAQDQLRSLCELAAGLPHIRAAIYDGDTPQAERAGIRAGANIVLSNPDMLYVGILPHHARWSRFLSRLRLVVVDEAHLYRGVFGSHVALLLRRLRRACALYGNTPRFVLASATIGNPREHLEALIGDRVTVVDEDGAPHGPRTLIFWNPPLLTMESGVRASTNVETTALFTELVAHEVRTLAFTKARNIAELLLRYARTRLAGEQRLSARISSYRAGYTPEDRRAIERTLLDHLLDHLHRRLPEPPHRFFQLQWPLEGRAAKVIRQDVWIGKRDARVLMWTAKEFLGMAHPVLIHRVVKRDQNTGAWCVAPSRSAPLLPRAGHGARIAVEDCDIKAADVDA